MPPDILNKLHEIQNMSIENNMWKTFHFESNRFFDKINNPNDWERLREAYPGKTDQDLLAAKEATYKGKKPQEDRDNKPNYGFRFEHDGEKTLLDFKQHNMLHLIPTKSLTNPEGT